MSLAGGMGKPWAPLHNDLNLFHFVEGPNNLARLAVERSISPTEVLTSYGLGALNAQSGFAKYCIARALEQMRDGKEPRHILTGVLTEGTVMAGLGVVAGAVGGYALARIVGSTIPDVKVPGVLPILGAAAVLLAAALIASLLPAARAARVDVMEALRSE